jgi:inosine triphosphate pyrophosphatase
MASSTLPQLTFVTGNKGKLAEVKAILDGVADVTNEKVDLPELQGRPHDVAKEKARTAYRLLKRPVMTEDTSLCFCAMNDLPGPYIKWFLEDLGLVGLNKMLVGFESKKAYAQCIFTVVRGEDDIVVYEGRCYGTIVMPQGPENFGWDPVFMPDGSDKTFAEMSKDAKNEVSHRARALAKLRAVLAPADDSPKTKKSRKE